MGSLICRRRVADEKCWRNQAMHIWTICLCKKPTIRWKHVNVFRNCLHFLIQYSLIISLEEERLDELFGQEYSRYKEIVPAVFPRIRKWGGSKSRKPTSIINTLKTEKRTLQNVAAVLILIFIRTQYYNG